jgi:hypothetical protein
MNLNGRGCHRGWGGGEESGHFQLNKGEQESRDAEDFHTLILLDADEANRGIQEEIHLSRQLGVILTKGMGISVQSVKAFNIIGFQPICSVCQKERRDVLKANSTFPQIIHQRIAFAQFLNDVF